MSIRTSVKTITSDNIDPNLASGKLILTQAWNGQALLGIQQRKDEKKKEDLTWVLPSGLSERWADSWAIPADAPHPVAAHAWINFVTDPKVAAKNMAFAGYPTPIPAALDLVDEALKSDPVFAPPQDVVDGYKFILNPSPAVVNAREKLYAEFKAS
jgi:spermidine/putrescine-binding protein